MPELAGKTIEMRLEEHPYHQRFLATISGLASVDDPYFEGTYQLKIEPRVAQKLSHDHVMFHPEYYEFHRNLLSRRDVTRESKELGKPSLDTFLMSPNLSNDGLRGRVYVTTQMDLIQAMAFHKHEFSVFAYGIITRPK